MLESITLLGSSSGRNAGDAALISGIMDSIDEACGQRLLYEIPTIKPNYIWYNYYNRVRPISMLPWSASIKMLGFPTFASCLRTDLTLIFDAILFDRSLYNPLFNYLSTLRVLLPLAKKKGKRIGFYDVGVGPVNTPAGQKMLKEISEMVDFISVRDESSLEILNQIGVKHPRIFVAADAALNLVECSEKRTEEIFNKLGLKIGEEILAVNLSKYIDSWASAGRKSMGKEKFLEVYADGLNQALEQIDAQVLFVCTQHHDVAVTLELMAKIRTRNRKAIFTNREYNHYDVKGVLGKVSLLCGMRLHATILASSALTPVIALPHQPKVEHYFKTLGLNDFVLNFDNFSAETLRDLYLKGWQSRAQQKEILSSMIPVSKRRARKPALLCAALRNGEDLDSALKRIDAEEYLQQNSSPARSMNA